MPSMRFEDHPISQVQWVSVNLLRSNSYNPNVVLSPELRLLAHSLLSGWIQPVLVNKEPESPVDEYEVIDGFHRYTLVKTDPRVYALTDGLVPVVVMALPRDERMMLTVRINRAKGTHVAVKMHEIVTELHVIHGVSIEKICEGIGASSHEVSTLLMENIFQKKDVANVDYSKAWVPKKRRANANHGG